MLSPLLTISAAVPCHACSRYPYLQVSEGAAVTAAYMQLHELHWRVVGDTSLTKKYCLPNQGDPAGGPEALLVVLTSQSSTTVYGATPPLQQVAAARLQNASAAVADNAATRTPGCISPIVVEYCLPRSLAQRRVDGHLGSYLGAG
eukprot:scaffold306_cov525-Prasinococcus_capsulatus_cf.AAC.24